MPFPILAVTEAEMKLGDDDSCCHLAPPLHDDRDNGLPDENTTAIL